MAVASEHKIGEMKEYLMSAYRNLGCFGIEVHDCKVLDEGTVSFKVSYKRLENGKVKFENTEQRVSECKGSDGFPDGFCMS